MTPFVLDCSVAISWCFEDQADGTAEAALDLLPRTEALAPSIWPLEVANVLLVAERRKKLPTLETSRFVALLEALPIVVETETPRLAFRHILGLARDERLSSYDATYLELAMRRGLPLATQDKQLRRTARRLGIALLAE